MPKIVCSGGLAKIFLVIFNTAMLVLSTIIIYIGIQVYHFTERAQLVELTGLSLETTGLVVLIVGSVLALGAIIGTMSVFVRWPLFLHLYSLLLLVAVIVQIGSIYHRYVLQESTRETIGTSVQLAINETFNARADAKIDLNLAYALQTFQTTFECCGWSGPEDFQSKEVPASCCMDNYTSAVPLESCSRLNLEFKSGCSESRVAHFVTSTFNWTANALILVQLVVLVAACCLARYLKAYQPVNTTD